ncbi:MAG: family 20 glycosylhydrolase, partial [bacterium]
LDGQKQLVRLCRLYKIRYLQLHLTDDQGFKFPSTAFPLLTTQNYSGPAYTLSELRELERYSQERGVTIIPELEIPGHEAAMNRAMPDLFKIKDTLPYEHHATINWAKQEVMDALDVLIGEICSVFQATPYFHVGGDEADFEFAHQNTNFVQRFQALGYAAPYTYDDSYQLYRRLLRTLNELITTKYSKQMLCWEGFHRDPSSSPLEPIPHTLPVMAFENTYYPASQLVADGYPVINTAWNPLYVVNGTQCSPENIYGWNLYRFGRYQKDWSQVQWVTVSPTTNVIGAQMCAWEQPETIELDSLRLRVAAMSERIWNPNADKTFADFSQRVLATDTLLSRLTGSPVNPAPAVTQTTSGIVPLTVTFTDPAGGSATNRYWNFGDGTWANTASSNAVHVYTNTGTYTVTLVASGPQAVSSNAWENLIIVYAPFMNAIPYQITFEPPGMNAGDSLFVPLNSNGWYGASGTEAHVTNLVYAWPSWAYPVSTATHSNVLTYQSALFSNRLAQASSPAQTVIDLMSRPGTLDARPDTNALADVHGGVFIDTNGHINAWCSGDQSHSNRTWLTYANTPVGATNWARLTVTFDYAGDKTNGLTYYSVALNGVALTVPGGAGYAKGDGRFLRSPSGTWLVSANPDAKRLNSVTFAGTGCLDDLVVSDELRMRPHTVLLIR